MKEDLEAPLALQKRALAGLMSLKVRPAPQLQLYRDIATAILRMEVVIRSTARQAMKKALSELCVGFCRNRRASWVF
jgi:hypothetical protein